MIKTKRVVLLISLLLMVAMLSGCMQAGVKLDLKSWLLQKICTEMMLSSHLMIYQ